MTSTDTQSWQPQESAADLWNERSYLAGILIGAVAYGVHATLFFITIKLLWARKRVHWNDYSWIAFVIVLFTLSSIGNGTQFKFTQMIYIDNRGYPGGPSAYLVEQQTAAAAVWCVGAYIVNNWLQDGLIIYRFSVFYGRRPLLMALPSLAFLANVGVSLTLLASIRQQSFFEAKGAHLLTAYYATSVALNGLCTLAIVFKLWSLHARLRRISSSSLGPHFTTGAMLIESAFMYSACVIAFLVPWGLQNPVQNLILPTLAQVESIAPLLIIMRVAQGEAWSSKAAARYETLAGGTSAIDVADDDVERGVSKSESITNVDRSSSIKDRDNEIQLSTISKV